MAIKASENWKSAKDEYMALTGMKKPREKVAAFFRTSHTGLSDCIAEMEAYDDIDPKKKSPEAYLKLMQKFDKAKDGYCKTLEKLIDEEDEKTVKVTEWKATGLDVKKVKTDMYRGLKMLKAKLDSFSTEYQVKYGIYQDGASTQTKVVKLENAAQLRVNNSFKKFAAATQAIKATPTVDVWNREFKDNDAVRTITTALGTYRAIEKEVGRAAMTPDQLQNLAKAGRWIAALSDWSNPTGAKYQLADGDDVLAELKACTAQVKACIQDYQ